MTQQLRTLPALPKDLSSSPSTHMVVHKQLLEYLPSLYKALAPVPTIAKCCHTNLEEVEAEDLEFLVFFSYKGRWKST